MKTITVVTNGESDWNAQDAAIIINTLLNNKNIKVIKEK